MMNIEFYELKEMVEELPIGLYAHRRIECGLSETKQTSYYNPKEDKIIISYPIIREGLKNAVISENYSMETAVRSMLYHEVSHAILTPCKLHHFWISTKESFDIMNIFEDERIETLLKDFYLDVNFKKQLLYISNGIQQPKNAIQGFYNLVRFRVGDSQFLARVAQIISTYKSLCYTSGIDGYCDNRNDYWSENDLIRDYVNAVNTLWKDYQKQFNVSSQSNAQNNQQISDDIENSSNGIGSELNNSNTSSSSKSGATNDSNSSNANGKSNSSQDLEEMLKKIEQEVNRGNGDKSQSDSGCSMGEESEENYLDKIINRTVNGFVDNALTTTLENIICQFNKKNKGGNGVNAYSGVFNPKAIMRDDYRYFERAMTSNGNNKFGTCHLNLFIDCSGSFSDNEHRVNTLIKSLSEVERRNKNFTFDTIFCGSGLHEIADKKNRWLNACESTEASYDEVKTCMKNHNLKNTMNYNIVLYDGYCYWNSKKNPFLAWDTDNTTLIVEKGNFKNVKELTKANVVKITDDCYVKHLTDEIIKILSIAFH